MASRWITQNDFTTGELDPRGLGRQDLERYPSAVAMARNVVIDKLGSLHVRGGWRWVDDVPANDRVQLRGWERDDDDYLIAIGEGSTLDLYGSDDELIDTLVGDVDGYVLSVIERNSEFSLTAVDQEDEHQFITGSGDNHRVAFGVVEGPLPGTVRPGWTHGENQVTRMCSVLVREPVAPASPPFSRETPTFKDQASSVTTWDDASHTFSADADLCIVRIGLEGASAVSSVTIDPGGDDIALTKLDDAVHSTRRSEIWGVFGFTPQTGAKNVRVVLSGGGSGSFAVDTFISAVELPLPQDLDATGILSGSSTRTSITVPNGGFGESSVGLIDTASDSKTMLFFHEDVETHWLHFTEADGWTFEPYPIEKYPYHRFQAPGVTLDPNGLSGSVTLTTSAAHWQPSHVGTIVRYGSGKDRIEVTAYTSSTVVTGTVLDTLPAHTATADWDEQVWSQGRGWPISGCWHQGRLVIGGARDLKDGFWVSKIGENVAEEEGVSFELGADDDDAIWTRIRADEGVNIEYVRSQGPLLILASGTEWIVPQQPLTPTNLSFDRQASQGVDRLKPADLDGAIIYLRAPRAGMDEEGEQNLVHFAWDELSQRYRPSDIGVLGQHLIRNPNDMAAARGSTADANNILYLTNDDGTVAALHLPTVDRPGMTLFDGEIEPYSVAVSAGRLYCAAEYNGAHRIFRLDPDSSLDASAAFDFEPWYGLIDFGEDNGAAPNRHYTIDDADELDLIASTGWAWGCFTKLSQNAGSAAQFLLSSGAFAANPSFNWFITEAGAGTPSAYFADVSDATTDNEVDSSGNSLDLGDLRLVVVQYNTATGNMELYTCDPGGSPVLQDSAAGPDGDVVAPGDWFFGRRSDGNPDRYFNEETGGLFKADRALISAEMEQLAIGVSPVTVLGADCAGAWAFKDGPQATEPDLVGSNDATRGGTGWGAGGSTSVGAFPWLANQEVTVKGLTASGWTIQTATADGSGAVTVTTAVEKGEVGLPFEWIIRRLPPEASPATVGSLKSPVEARVMVKDTLAIEVGDEDGRVPMTLEGGSALGDLTTDPPTPFTGHLRDHLMGGWSEEPITELGGAAPWSATVLVFNVKVEF